MEERPRKFVRWDSQSLDEWAGRYARGAFLNLDGRRTHYIERGKGAAVVLLHGFGSDSSSFASNIDALAACFKVYALDLWGFGYSTREMLDFGYALYASQLASLMDAMKIEKAVLVGQSMGGGVALRFASERAGRVAALILISAAGLPNRHLPIQRIMTLPGVGEFLLGLPTDFIRKLAIRKAFVYDASRISKERFDELTWSQKIKGSNKVFLNVLRRSFFDNVGVDPATIRAQKIPTLIVWGRHDRSIPLRTGLELGRLLGTSVTVFENSGHESHDEEPEKFNELAISFIRGSISPDG